ncbi:MAG: hypothetical protein ACRDUS_00795 [Mycobacterium sp.]
MILVRISRIRSIANRFLPVLALVVFGAVGLGSAAVTASAAPLAPTSVMSSALADPGDDGPDADVSGPDDTDSDNVAPPAPASGTGAGCENAGAECSGDEGGTVLTSDNDEV